MHRETAYTTKNALDPQNLVIARISRETDSRGATKLSQSEKSEANRADDFAPGRSGAAQEEDECRAAQTARGQSFRNRIHKFGSED